MSTHRLQTGLGTDLYRLAPCFLSLTQSDSSSAAQGSDFETRLMLGPADVTAATAQHQLITMESSQQPVPRKEHKLLTNDQLPRLIMVRKT